MRRTQLAPAFVSHWPLYLALFIACVSSLFAPSHSPLLIPNPGVHIGPPDPCRQFFYEPGMQWSLAGRSQGTVLGRSSLWGEMSASMDCYGTGTSTRLEPYIVPPPPPPPPIRFDICRSVRSAVNGLKARVGPWEMVSRVEVNEMIGLARWLQGTVLRRSSLWANISVSMDC